jgi:long-chain acyl-CoA synthetase
MNEDVKLYLERDFGTVADLIRLHAKDPKRVAFKTDTADVTYRQLDKLVDRIAATLQDIGTSTRVAICAQTSVKYVAAYLGALRAGMSVVPLPTYATAETLDAMLLDSDAKVCFVDESTFEKVGVPKLLLEDAYLWSLTTAPTPVDVCPSTEFAVVYSSGTTGVPKGVVQSHSMRWALARRGLQFEYDEHSVALVSTPLYSSTTSTVLFTTLAFGGALVLMPKFDAALFLQLAAARRVTHAILVPVQYRRIMSLSNFGDFDLSAFKYKFCTSSHFPESLKADVLARWPGGLVEFYGMTEGGGTCILEAHKHPTKLHTVGKPAPKHEIKIIDDAGDEVPVGHSGEIVGRSAVMMEGYLNKPDLTAQAEWFADDGRRFIRSGDIGKFDEDGFVVLLDRKKDMIISGGFNIYPSDLEEQLRQYGGVADVAVVGVPSDVWGETPVAFVVGQDLDVEHLKTRVNERVGSTQRLSDVVLVDELPRSQIGKVLKKDLRDLYCNSKEKL